MFKSKLIKDIMTAAIVLAFLMAFQYAVIGSGSYCWADTVLTITGSTKTITYDGQKHSAEGFTWSADGTEGYGGEISVSLKEGNTSLVEGTEPGTYKTDWSSDDFVINAGNVNIDEVVVKNIVLEIQPVEITVNVIGNSDVYEFNGTEQSVTGYTLGFEDAAVLAENEDGGVVEKTVPAEDIAEMYNESNISFDADLDGTPDSKNAAMAKGTYVGRYDMNLVEGTFTDNDGQFSNKDDHFAVTFVVKNGFFEIIYREKPYVVIIKSPDVPSTYNGKKQTYTIRAGVDTIDALNPVETAVNFILEKIGSFFTLTSSADDGGVEFTVKDGSKEVTYKMYNLEVRATGTEYGEYGFELINAPVIKLGEVDVSMQFAIETDLGSLIIEKAKVVVRAYDKTKRKGEKDPELSGSITGLLEGDEMDVSYERDPGDEVGVDYEIRPIVAVEKYPDYDIEIINGKFTITDPDEPEPEPDPVSGQEPEPEPKDKSIVAAPKKMKASGENALMIKWTKIKGAEGYDIFFNKCNKNKSVKIKTIKGNKKFSWKKTGLKSGKPYKAYVRAWVKEGGKKKYISKSPELHAYTGNGTKKYTNVKAVKVAKEAVTLKAGKAFKIKAKLVKISKDKKLMPKGHTRKLRYLSMNKKIATVTKAGKIKARASGKCVVYVFAHNGAYAKVKVTVGKGTA